MHHRMLWMQLAVRVAEWRIVPFFNFLYHAHPFPPLLSMTGIVYQQFTLHCYCIYQQTSYHYHHKKLAMATGGERGPCSCVRIVFAEIPKQPGVWGLSSSFQLSSASAGSNEHESRKEVDNSSREVNPLPSRAGASIFTVTRPFFYCLPFWLQEGMLLHQTINWGIILYFWRQTLSLHFCYPLPTTVNRRPRPRQNTYKNRTEPNRNSR